MLHKPLFSYLATILLVLLLSCTALCQDFPMQHYTVEDGLPSNTVYEIYRDSKGFLWFATDKGIARYNGIKFETFTTFNGLPDNEVFFFQEDYYGRLWLGTYNGELCYYKDDTFHTAVNTPFLKLPFKAPFIKMISLEKDSSVTICFSEQFEFLNIVKDKYQVYHLDINSISMTSSPFNQILQVKKQVGNMFEITLQDRIVRINEHSDIKYISPIFNNGIIERFPCQNKEYFLTDSTVFTNDFVFKLNKYHFKSSSAKKYDKYNIRSNNFNRAYFNGKSVFFATNKGLIINDSIHILNDDNISSITQDNIGRYWISSLNNGTYTFSFFTTQLFKKIYYDKIKYSHIIKLHLFFTTSNNNLYMIENNVKKCLFDYQKYMNAEYNYPESPAYLLTDKNKYYAFYNYNFFVIDNVLSDNNVLKTYTNNHYYDGIKFIYELDSNIILQNRRSLWNINYQRMKKNDEVQAFSYTVIDTGTNNRIYCSAKSPDNYIWYSTINNVYKINNYQEIPQVQFGNIKLKSFTFQGKYLIGYTHNNQLLICSNYNDAIKIDTVPPQNCIWEKFQQLDSNHVLLTTNNLYRLLTLYPPGSKKKYTISAIENPFIPLQAESICADSENCYFFKNGDITSVAVKSILIKAAPPKLFLKSLKAGTKSYQLSSDIQVPFSEAKNITINFSTLSFSSKDVSYQYSISKNDQDNWRDFTGDINLANINYGAYTIKVKAKTISSEYSTPIVFTLTVLRPYWASWWFITLCLLIMSVVIVIIIRKRIAYILRRKEKDHLSEVRFMKSEYKALNALMNPHFIFNTLNNVQALVNKNDKLAANEYLRVFADLIRQNMQNVSKELIPLEKEIDLVSNYLILEKLRFENNLNYIIDIDEDLDLSDIMIPPLLIQPLVENSIKHGIFPLESSDGTIRIDLHKRDGVLYIEIKDNGIGVQYPQQEKDPKHESFGLENIRQRIAKLSVIQNKNITFNIGEIRDGSGKLQWTVVTITIPFA